MNRRRYLRGVAGIGAAGAAGFAGCLERLGFEEESAWANPPLVENRPDAVYLPASREEMGMYGTASDGDYAVALSYTFPHRFWTVEATSEGKQLVEVDADDSLHLMLTVWDRETDTVLPVDPTIEVLQDGSLVDAGISAPWPMISQRMGFHYGDNIRLPGEGEYTVRARVGPVTLDRTGAFEDRLDAAATLEVDFEYTRADITDLSFETIDEEDRGSPDALSLMDHGGHSGGDTQSGHGDGELGSPPMGQGPSIEELSGEVLGTERSGDANVSALVTDADRFGDGAYLAVFTRTPYNDIILPFTSLSATVERDGDTVYDGVPFTSLSATVERDGDTVYDGALVEALDSQFGHHYGVGVDEFADGDRVTVTVDSPPLVSRHDGYETAFFDFEAVSYTV